MKAIMLMFDSLSRRMLPPYGCGWVQAPNFQRLAERSLVFDNCYAGSLPCMPARRELHTGRYNFLHRGWGPLEPFDDSLPEILKKNGVYTHLATDHYHYFEDGGGTYHGRYSSWEFARGQEGDPWKGQVKDPAVPDTHNRQGALWQRQDWINRAHMQREKDHYQARTFAQGLEFIATNAREDKWFLQLEEFDPHPPFFVPRKYQDLYPHDYDGPHWDWPPYARVTQDEQAVQHLRYQNAALISMCDAYLGQVLDAMDEMNLWPDTMLIVNTDHGFLLGEHDWWALCRMPFYDEIAHTPLFIWDPRCGGGGERRRALVQTIDLPATLLEFFGVGRPRDMQGAPLRETIATGAPVREAALFGMHGGQVNVTDGRYVYMRAPLTPANEPLYDYTLMTTHMKSRFGLAELREVALAEPFAFTKGLRTLRTDPGAGRSREKRGDTWLDAHSFGNLLFDLETDPHQERPLQDAAAEARMVAQLVRLMQENDAPPEQYQRLGLPEEKG